MLNSLTDPNIHIDQLYKAASEVENTKVPSHLKTSVFDKLDAAAIPSPTTTGAIATSKIIIASSIIITIIAAAVWYMNNSNIVETSPQIKTEEKNTVKAIQKTTVIPETVNSDKPIVEPTSSPIQVSPTNKKKEDKQSSSTNSTIKSPTKTDTLAVSTIHKPTKPTETEESIVVEKIDSITSPEVEIIPKKSLMEQLKEKEFKDNLFKKDQ